MDLTRNLLNEANVAVSRVVGVTVLGAACLVLSGLSACASDEPVGHSRTTTKRTIDTPTAKTTVTETHEKDTKVYP